MAKLLRLPQAAARFFRAASGLFVQGAMWVSIRLRKTPRCLNWWSRYSTQLLIGSTETSAPSFSRKLEHLVVAVALGLLRPEFADHLDHRLHPQPVRFHSIQRLLRHWVSAARKRLP